MGEQRTFASMAWEAKAKLTRRERFLAEMDAVIPWSRLLAIIQPYYAQLHLRETPHRLAVVDRIFGLRVRQIEPLLQEVDAQHLLQPQRLAALPRLGRRPGAGREYDSALSPSA